MQMCFYKVSPSSMCPGVTSSSATQTMCLAGQCSSDRSPFYFHFMLFSSSYTALATVSNNTELVLWCILWELHRVPVLGWLCVWEPFSGTEVPAVRALGSLQNHFTLLQWAKLLPTDPALSWLGGLQLQSRCFRPPWQSSDTRHVKDKAQTLSLQLCHRRPAASIIPVALTSDPIQVFSFQGGLT